MENGVSHRITVRDKDDIGTRNVMRTDGEILGLEMFIPALILRYWTADPDDLQPRLAPPAVALGEFVI